MHTTLKPGHQRLTACILLLIVCAVILGTTMPTSAAPSQINFNQQDVERAWQNWRDRQITATNAGPAPRRRVMSGDPGVTVSEGQAYGILLASLFDEQTLLDGLWLFAADHLNNTGLMHWRIGGYGEIWGAGAATDAEVDMAMGLINACEKVRNGQWSPSSYGIDYCQVANDLLDAMWTYEIDKPGGQPARGMPNNPGYELMPGDSWNIPNYPEGIVNLSYFAPGYFRVFAQFSGNDGWLDVVERNYDIAEVAASLPGNCSGLVSNWNNYNGGYAYTSWHGASSEFWGWDAARFAWRVAVDRHWFDSPRAAAAINPIGSFFASVGVDDVRSEYRLNGNYVESYRTAYFVATSASAIWAADLEPVNCGQARGQVRSTPQDGYDETLAMEWGDYYNEAWRVLTLVLLSGNFTNPYADNAPPPPTSTPVPPTNTPQPPTNTPVPPTSTPEPDGPPTVQGIPDQNNKAGDDVALQVEAGSNHPTDPTLRFAAENLPAGLSIDAVQGQIAGTIADNAADNSPYNVAVTVTDVAGKTSVVTFTWTITPPGDQPPPEGDVRVELKQNGPVNEQQSQFAYKLTNTGDSPQTDLKLRLYFMPDAGRSGSEYVVDKYWDESGDATVSGPFAANGSADGHYYYEIAYNGTLNAGQSWQYHGNLRLSDWQWQNVLDNDWWRQGGFPADYTPTTTIPVYAGGTRIFGEEPGGAPPPQVTNTPQPQPTNTPVPPTSTPIPPPTSTSPPGEPTSTPRPTNTAVPPTSTPRPTNTPVPPPTGGSVAVQMRAITNNNQQTQFEYRLQNTGGSALSGLSVRYYFTPDAGRAATDYAFARYWDQSNSGSISGPIQAGNAFYYQVTYSGTLQPGQTWEFKGALHLKDWRTEYNAANDWTSGGLGSQYGPYNRLPVFQNGQRIAGNTP